MPQNPTDLTLSIQQGDANAVRNLLPLVYDELHALAARKMQFERAEHTLQPTALVNEVFLRMVDQSRVDWLGKAHFCAVAATMMRRVLVDHARQRNAGKRGGQLIHRVMDDFSIPELAPEPVDLVMVDDLMEHLAKLNPRHAQVVELRCFGGLCVAETAEVLQVSEATVKNDWRFARAWLAAQLRPEDES
ncbi:MAG: sigma-70 family RNA polymerase sigma factor [Planctomycetaceae bacterium]|nr:sigma-70 family RNA polymerase sigma factor [Planctomycetaceae bacterium]